VQANSVYPARHRGNGAFLYTDVEPYLYDKAASNVTIGTANNGKLHGNMRGKLKAQVLNVAGYDGLQPSVPFDIAATTVPKIANELLSVDDQYRYGRFNVLLRQPDYEDGVSELFRAATATSPAVRIPLVYDYRGKGGWHMYYMPTRDADAEDMQLLSRHIADEIAVKGVQAANDSLNVMMTEAEDDSET